jgi:hypothetical protein
MGSEEREEQESLGARVGGKEGRKKKEEKEKKGKEGFRGVVICAFSAHLVFI